MENQEVRARCNRRRTAIFLARYDFQFVNHNAGVDLGDGWMGVASPAIELGSVVPKTVSTALVAAIHGSTSGIRRNSSTPPQPWITGTSPVMTIW
jgi:hypothetical protein